MKRYKTEIITICLLLLFVVFTLLVKYVDVKAIGPLESKVGLATINGAFASYIGSNFVLYNITDWMGLMPIAIGITFGIVGLV